MECENAVFCGHKFLPGSGGACSRPGYIPVGGAGGFPELGTAYTPSADAMATAAATHLFDLYYRVAYASACPMTAAMAFEYGLSLDTMTS